LILLKQLKPQLEYLLKNIWQTLSFNKSLYFKDIFAQTQETLCEFLSVRTLSCVISSHKKRQMSPGGSCGKKKDNSLLFILCPIHQHSVAAALYLHRKPHSMSSISAMVLLLTCIQRTKTSKKMETKQRMTLQLWRIDLAWYFANGCVFLCDL